MPKPLTSTSKPRHPEHFTQPHSRTSNTTMRVICFQLRVFPDDRHQSIGLGLSANDTVCASLSRGQHLCPFSVYPYRVLYFFITIETSDLKIIYFSIGKSAFKNFWFSEISDSNRTKMSPNTFFYLLKIKS